MNKRTSFSVLFDWPRSVSKYSFLDIGGIEPYFDPEDQKKFNSWYKSIGKKILLQIAENKTAVSIYFSGPFIELMMEADPRSADIIKSAIADGTIEILGGTYHHSFSCLYSIDLFKKEILWHSALMKKAFGCDVNHFFNTENVYYNNLAQTLAKQGFTSCFTGAIDWYLGENQNQRVFRSKDEKKFHLLLVSDDQGAAIFDQNEIADHFVLMDCTQLQALGGWKEIVRKVSGKTEIVTIDNHLQRSDKGLIYSAKQPITGSYQGYNLETFTKHPLQKNWLNQLYELAPAMMSQPESIQKIWSSFGNKEVLLQLNPNLQEPDSNVSYDTFHSLINILNDLQLRF